MDPLSSLGMPRTSEHWTGRTGLSARATEGWRWWRWGGGWVGGWSREGVGLRKERTNFCVKLLKLGGGGVEPPRPPTRPFILFTRKYTDPDRCVCPTKSWENVLGAKWNRYIHGNEIIDSRRFSHLSFLLRSLGSRIIENKLSLEEWLNAERFDSSFLLGAPVTNDRNICYSMRE